MILALGLCELFAGAVDEETNEPTASAMFAAEVIAVALLSVVKVQ